MAKNSLREWFAQNDGKGWVDCKTGKPCGRQKGEKRRGYPACRPTMAQCTSAAKKKKSSKRIGRLVEEQKSHWRISKGCYDEFVNGQ